jgi:hypothetical protein
MKTFRARACTPGEKMRSFSTHSRADDPGSTCRREDRVLYDLRFAALHDGTTCTHHLAHDRCSRSTTEAAPK